MKTATARLPAHDIQLADLVPADSPEKVQQEVHAVLQRISPNFDTTLFDKAFHWTVNLFRGNHPDFQACNTGYHDLNHTLDVLLAMVRLIHGAVATGVRLSEQEIQLGLVAALFHDAGYIQSRNDLQGTGAKYTTVHEQRGMSLLSRYGGHLELTASQISDSADIIVCTDLSVSLSDIRFRSDPIRLLGRMLATSDLVGQLADRIYLEKLLFLFYEFRESNIGGYRDEVDLLAHTPGFFTFAAHRLGQILDGADRLLKIHFHRRWNIPRDLYSTAIHRQKDYLEYILKRERDPRRLLKRSGIVEKVRAAFSEPPVSEP